MLKVFHCLGELRVFAKLKSSFLSQNENTVKKTCSIADFLLSALLEDLLLFLVVNDKTVNKSPDLLRKLF